MNLMNNEQRSPKHISGNILKYIALISMTIDHIGCVLFPDITFLRYLGRLAFPIYCFLLVEGFYYTSNRKRYRYRLAFFALLSELPFNLAIFHTTIYLQHQNVFFTLFLGFCLLESVDAYRIRTNATPDTPMGFEYLLLILFVLIAEVLRTDYGGTGILLIFAIFVFHNQFIKLAVAHVLLQTCVLGGIQWFSNLALIPIYFYSPECHKPYSTVSKYFFYIYYPFHLVVLYLISRSL